MAKKKDKKAKSKDKASKKAKAAKKPALKVVAKKQNGNKYDCGSDRKRT